MTTDPNQAPDPEGALWARIQGEVQRERGPVAWLRARPTGVRLAFALVAAFGVVLLVALVARRTDFEAHALLPVVGGAAGLALAVLVCVALALRPYHRPAPRPVVVVAWAAVGLLLPLALILLAPAHQSVHAHPESFAGTGADFWPRAGACFALGALLGVPVLLVLRLLDRRTRPTWPRILTLAAVAGLVGNLALSLHCPLVSGAHLLAGHATVPLGALAVLALSRLPRRA